MTLDTDEHSHSSNILYSYRKARTTTTQLIYTHKLVSTGINSIIMKFLLNGWIWLQKVHTRVAISRYTSN